MDHRPFEDWLLSDEPLTPAQKRELQVHLRTCAECTSLAEVDLALQSTRMAAPAEGFTGRFQVRLAAHRQALRWRKFWGFVILAVSVSGLLLWLAWPALAAVLKSPVNLLASWLTYLIPLWASLRVMGQVSALILRVVPGFVPAFIWPVILFAAAGWCLIWVFSLMKFTKKLQGV